MADPYAPMNLKVPLEVAAQLEYDAAGSPDPHIGNAPEVIRAMASEIESLRAQVQQQTELQAPTGVETFTIESSGLEDGLVAGVWRVIREPSGLVQIRWLEKHADADREELVASLLGNTFDVEPCTTYHGEPATRYIPTAVMQAVFCAHETLRSL